MVTTVVLGVVLGRRFITVSRFLKIKGSWWMRAYEFLGLLGGLLEGVLLGLLNVMIG